MGFGMGGLRTSSVPSSPTLNRPRIPMLPRDKLIQIVEVDVAVTMPANAPRSSSMRRESTTADGLRAGHQGSLMTVDAGAVACA